ncbi:hypothetical protein XI25_27485 [Paenibacillus sp. DMB20]|nr:hypothetical protein XI25_27485 [Paenibacillus sp. DMB20]
MCTFDILYYAEWIKDRYELQFIDIYPVDDSNPFIVVSVSGTMLGNKKARDPKDKVIFQYDY